jgi:hypothetical protein
MTFKVPEKYRKKDAGAWSSDESFGCNGMFELRIGKQKRLFRVIAADGGGWEHVSVSTHDRCPTWAEMCAIKDLFWDSEDYAFQFHPAKSMYVNCHRNTLHLWRPIGITMPVPPSKLVGPVP